MYKSQYEIADDDATKASIFDKIVAWMQDPEHYASSCGEGMAQDDNCQIDAINLIIDIVDDCLKPKEVNPGAPELF